MPQLTAEQKAEVVTAEQRVSVILGDAYNDLGTTQARQRQYVEALSNFQQAERWNPNIPHLMRNIGFAAFRANEHAEAARALKIAEQQEPGDKMIPPMLAMSLFSIDQYAEAAKAFEKMGDSVYGDPRVAYADAVSLARVRTKGHGRRRGGLGWRSGAFAGSAIAGRAGVQRDWRSATGAGDV